MEARESLERLAGEHSQLVAVQIAARHKEHRVKSSRVV